MARPVTGIERKRMRAMRAEGKSIRAICAEFDRDTGLVHAYTRDIDVKAKSGRPRQFCRVQLVKLKRHGVSQADIARRFGVTEQAISYAAEALGYSQKAMGAASELDAAGIYGQKDNMDALMPKLKALTEPLAEAKAECRAK